jgi:anti-sigma factor RsiW
MMRWIMKLLAFLTGLFMSTCREATEGCTDYAEGALPERERGRIRRHMVLCAHCKAYRAQMETGLRALHGLPKEPMTAGEKDALAKRFRERKAN